MRADAWIVADEISNRRGQRIDFSDPSDQAIILGALYIRHVRRAEKNIRYAGRIDQAVDGDEGRINTCVNRLPANETTDPLVTLLLLESTSDIEVLIESSYSQAIAYVMTFVHFNTRQATCMHLAIAETTLIKRVAFAVQTLRRQPSLFDQIEKIAQSFVPSPGQQYAARVEHQYSAMQLRWEF